MESDETRPAWRPETIAVTAGRPLGPGAPLNQPPVHASVFRDGGPVEYGRFGNPTWTAFEAALGGLEGGEALAFSSGMAAIAAVLGTLPHDASVVVESSSYIGTRAFLAEAAGDRRLRSTAVDTTDTGATLRALDGADLLWLESPTNPLLGIADLAALLDGAAARGVRSVVDNTFATPMLQQPLRLGASAVVHSATKYIGGHADLILGAVVTSDDDLRARLLAARTLHGATAGVTEAWLALRGLRTLPVRLACAQESAGILARRLAGHPRVTRVRYPGLPSDPGYALAARQMTGPGAMVSFELADGAAATALQARLRLVVAGTSLGGVETLIDRRHRWPGEEHVPPGLLRMSVGLEHVEDLWDDLRSALDS